MAKTRAQRKAEARKRAQQSQRPEGTIEPTETDTEAQRQTQVPESADVIEAELAEQGADLDALRGRAEEAPAPSRADVGRPAETAVDEPQDKISRRARKREEREARARAKESERRRAPKETRAPVEQRQRGGVMGFFASCVAELRRVQWPDRETLIQATAITVVFIAAMSAYLGILDGIFNWLVQRIL